jgi:hypothetical protein
MQIPVTLRQNGQPLTVTTKQLEKQRRYLQRKRS